MLLLSLDLQLVEGDFYQFENCHCFSNRRSRKALSNIILALGGCAQKSPLMPAMFDRARSARGSHPCGIVVANMRATTMPPTFSRWKREKGIRENRFAEVLRDDPQDDRVEETRASTRRSWPICHTSRSSRRIESLIFTNRSPSIADNPPPRIFGAIKNAILSTPLWRIAEAARCAPPSSITRFH